MNPSEPTPPVPEHAPADASAGAPHSPRRSADRTWIAAGLSLGVVVLGIVLYWIGPPSNPLSGQEGPVNVKVFNQKGQLVGPIEVQRVVKTDSEWRAQLTSAQYLIARAKGTERAFCGTLLDNKRDGVYACVCCRLPLFTSAAKFKSHSGWPSFFAPVCEENVVTVADRSHGMVREEILCARCDCHLGHVFTDGPAPTGLRYCVNSESLVFIDQADLATLADEAADHVKGTPD